MSDPILPPDLAAKNAAINAYVQNPGKVQRLSPGRLAELRDRMSKPLDVLPTFLPSWNLACRGPGGGEGLAYGQYVILAGPTGAGKTLLALNLTVRALREGVHVLYFSLEMSWDELALRLRPIVTGGDVTTTEWGRRYDPEAAAAADAALTTLQGHLYVNTEPIWKLEDIRSSMEAAYEMDGVRLFVVDYAQLVEPSGSDRKLFEAMTAISSQLRYTGKRLGAITVTVSQLNRDSTRDKKAAPSVDWLFGSSRFGFDADQALILDTRKRKSVPEHREDEMDLVIVKNRNGPQLKIPVALSTKTLCFRERLPDEEPSSPVKR